MYTDAWCLCAPRAGEYLPSTNIPQKNELFKKLPYIYTYIYYTKVVRNTFLTDQFNVYCNLKWSSILAECCKLIPLSQLTQNRDRISSPCFGIFKHKSFYILTT